MCVYAYYMFTVVSIVSMETQIMCMYIYYTVVLVPLTLYIVMWTPKLVVAFIYHMHFHETEFCVVLSPSMKLQHST